MKKRLFTMVVALMCVAICLFALAACENDDANNDQAEQGEQQPQTVAVESVTVDKTALELTIGEEATLTATVTPDNATDKTVVWSSDNTAVATVENGKVTAIASGSATVTAKAGDKTATCSVTVKTVLTEDTDFDALVSDKVTEEEWEAAFSESAFQNCTFRHSGTTESFEGLLLKIDGNNRYLHAFGSDMYLIETDDDNYMFLYNDGNFMENPNWAGMTESARAWYFSYVLVCTDFRENYDMFVYDEVNGEYVCSASVTSNSIMEPSGNVEYSDIHIKFYDKTLAYISIENKWIEISIYDNGTTQVTVPSEIEDAINNDQTEEGGQQTQPVAVESVTVDKTALELTIGEEATLTATVTPDNATDKTVVWSSDNTAVATVENGKVTAIASGSATVTAKAGDKTATCFVTVKAVLTEDTDFDALVSDKVTEEEWEAAFSESAFDNVTLKVNAVGVYAGTATFSIDNKTIYFTSIRGDGETFTLFMFEKEGNTYGGTVDENGNCVAVSLNYPPISYRYGLPDFGANFDDFAYSDEKGAYVYNGEGIENSVAPILFDEGGTVNCKNITIKIKGNRIAYFSCEIADYNNLRFDCRVYDYGTTEFEQPTLVDAEDESAISGKTFVYSRTTSDDVSSEVLETMNAQMKNSGMVFSTDGTFVITQIYEGTTSVQSGTYVQEGDAITMEITSITANGSPVEGPALPIYIYGTFDGEQFYYTAEFMPGVFATNFFALEK